MSFPPYSRHKASGVEWLGDVPEHWDVRRLKFCFRLITEKATDHTRAIALENIESWSGRLLETDSEFEGQGVAFQAGDILFGKLRPYLAKVHLAEEQGEAVGDFHVLRPGASMLSQYGACFLLNRDFISIVDGSTYGAKMPRVSWEFLADTPVLIPPRDEQIAIAAFLDCEKTKIDALVEEQKDLIELLKEKRQAIITHAVTKGLDPNASMKPSGIEWLGSVPEHWHVASVKRVAEIFVPQRNKPDLNVHGDGVPWVTMENIGREELKESQYFVSDTAARLAGSRILRSGNVVASCVGTFGVGSINHEDVVINQQLQAYVPSQRIDARFLRYVVLSNVSYFDRVATVATLPYVNQIQFALMPLGIPPFVEQIEIVRRLTSALDLIDDAVNDTNHAVDLLLERRSALVSAAVTGKIDVRETKSKVEAA